MEYSENQNWNIWQKIFLRFIFLYFVLYIYPYGFEYIRNFDRESISFWKEITIWFGESFLNWEFDREKLYNGFDSKYDYSRFLLITILSFLGSFFWYFIDYKFKFEYNLKIQTLLRTILRYHVGLTLIIYGFSKVFMLQFGEMNINTMENSIGDHNAMRFLWVFMSYSKFYTMTTGWIEVIGGFLLLFRKTTFLGSIILFIAMVNVVLLDIGYDVRVKMFAIHLLLMNLILLGNNLKGLLNFIVFNKPTSANIEHSLFTSKRNKKVMYILKGVLLSGFTIMFYFNYSDRISSSKNNNYPTLTMSHEVKSHIINKDTLDQTSKKKWKNISINGNSWNSESLRITDYDNQKTTYSFKADTILKTIEFYPFKDFGSEPYSFSYKELPNKEFVFEGTYKNDSILILTKFKTLEDYPLTANKIKWITDLKE